MAPFTPGGRIEVRVYTTTSRFVSLRPSSTTTSAATTRPQSSTFYVTGTPEQLKPEPLTTRAVYTTKPQLVSTTSIPNYASTTAATLDKTMSVQGFIYNVTNYVREVKEEVKRLKREFLFSEQQGTFEENLMISDS
jgi:hypothetical protein